MKKLRQDLILRKIGDDYIIVESNQGMADLSKVHTFNETAAWLWKQFESRDIDTAAVAALLCDRYDVSEEQATADAKSLLRKFEDAGLFER